MAERRSVRRSSRGGDNVTVQDLADAAGVSIASVSRALNNSVKVSDDVRRRVRDAADRLGYVPHAAARALASQSTHTIGAVVPTLENPNFAIGVEALQKRLTQAGYTLFVASCGY
ncbi:MAG: LacI family DNA-binding transcriptional regulator, partial [Alphaproteobacteria bacterium]|nr:LacI family DNA-binding transcriptional regulator [Alphaproteobacteria bacterium]